MGEEKERVRKTKDMEEGGGEEGGRERIGEPTA